MKARLYGDSRRGPGYATLEISGARDCENAAIIVRRASDGKCLTAGGWRDGDLSLPDGQRVAGGDSLLVYLDPSLTDNLAPTEEYGVFLEGVGAAPLDKEQFYQSRVVENFAGIDGSEGGAVYEGVEASPEIEPEILDGGFDGGASGVAAASDKAIIEKRPRRRGCMLALFILGALWLIVGWYLWRGVLNAPVKQADEDDAPFEFIPSSRD